MSKIFIAITPKPELNKVISGLKEEQKKIIEAQIAELRGTHNYIRSLKEQNFKLVPPVVDKN